MHNLSDIIRLTADQLDGIACIRCAATDAPMTPAGTGEHGQLFECTSHIAGCNLNLAKDSLSPAQRNGRACVQCGASDSILKPAGVLLDVKVVECENHAWERTPPRTRRPGSPHRAPPGAPSSTGPPTTPKTAST